MKRIFIVILVVLTLIMCSVPAFAAPAAGTYTVTATAEPAEGGDVTGGGNIAHGKNAELTATPKDGRLTPILPLPILLRKTVLTLQNLKKNIWLR
ncbi:MAG: hypothetical protein RR389_03745 [Christensenella sp.]